MNLKRLFVLIPTSLVSSLSLASPLNHNNILIGYAASTNDTADYDLVAVEGQKLVTPNIVIKGFIVEITDSSGLPSGYSVDGRAVSLSMLGLAKLSENAEFLAGIQVLRAKTEIGTPSGSSVDTDTYKALEAAINFSTNINYEVNLYLSRDIGEDENETEYGVGGYYYFNSDWSIGLRYFRDTSPYNYSEKNIILKYDFK